MTIIPSTKPYTRVELSNSDVIVVDESSWANENVDLVTMNQNIYRLRPDGSIVWQVGDPRENFVIKDINSPFLDVRRVEKTEKFEAYNSSGFLCELDPETGKLGKMKFIK